MKHDTNPVDGKPLKQSDLIKLNFARNDEDQYVDPVTFKVLTDNTHVVAIRHGDSANVFAYDTIERLNIKTKMWRDLLSDEEFSRKDILTLQDPQNLESRDLSSFKYIQDDEDSGIRKENPDINTAALGSSVRVLKAKEAVAKARGQRTALPPNFNAEQKVTPASSSASGTPSAPSKPKKIPYNASNRTSGLAAASLTSTGFTPHTSADRALLSEEEYLLKRGRVKEKGYVRLFTSLGDLTLELYPEYAPKAVYNFVRLCQSGFYDGIIFHRNIRNFMIQTGDETGTGRGGKSIWGKSFEDEFEGPLKHDSRGILSMANKGKNTNSSQFFIVYRSSPHLDRKHTIFGRVVEGLDVLDLLEEIPVDSNDRPKEQVKIVKAVVFVDPFENFLKKQQEAEKEKGRSYKEVADDRTTWTGKRILDDGSIEDGGGVGVGKYLKKPQWNDTRETEFDDTAEPARKKSKVGTGGFGNFEGW